jgi:hypothetical protein
VNIVPVTWFEDQIRYIKAAMQGMRIDASERKEDGALDPTIGLDLLPVRETDPVERSVTKTADTTSNSKLCEDASLNSVSAETLHSIDFGTNFADISKDDQNHESPNELSLSLRFQSLKNENLGLRVAESEAEAQVRKLDMEKLNPEAIEKDFRMNDNHFVRQVEQSTQSLDSNEEQGRCTKEYAEKWRQKRTLASARIAPVSATRPVAVNLGDMHCRRTIDSATRRQLGKDVSHSQVTNLF